MSANAENRFLPDTILCAKLQTMYFAYRFCIILCKAIAGKDFKAAETSG